MHPLSLVPTAAISFDIRRPTIFQFVDHFVRMGDEFYAFSPNSSSEMKLGDSDHRRGGNQALVNLHVCK